MSRANPAILAAIMIGFAAVLGGVTFWPGAFYIRLHEGDTLHLVSILLRMEDGQRPHLDFMTPIGALAFAPIVLFLKTGLGVGMSILAAQFLVAAVLAPAIWWVALSRYPGRWAWVFAAVALTLVLGMMFGGTEASISMHYNRWAWAVTFLMVSVAVLPVIGRPRPRIDGVILGAGAAALVLTKMAFFVGVGPAILLILVVRRKMATLGVAVIVGGLVAVGIALWGGVDFWASYARDLLVVATAETRPHPGAGYAGTAASPAFLGGSLLALAAVVILRRSGAKNAGLALMLLFPGFVLIAWQNWGNEPRWLWLLGLMLVPLGLRIDNEAGDWLRGRRALTLVAAMAMALSFGTFINILLSPFRHVATDKSDYVALISGDPRLADLLTVDIRALRLNRRVDLTMPGATDAPWNDPDLRDEPAILLGEALEPCETQLGISAWTAAISADLAAAGYGAGTQIFTADVFSAFWLYGPQDALESGAPWYYGGLTGLQNADVMLVPLCPNHEVTRKRVLDEVAEFNVPLTEVHRTPDYVLLKVDAP
ncbi:MAG: hypothetical protein GKR99_05750 [Rhodobacteraceae bacterium]|nr:hypothetical protein [Paracoccaceae bacterium]